MVKKEENIMTYQNEDVTITVNEDWCKKCGICIQFCPKKVLVANKKGCPVAEHIDDCIQCMLCELRCPDIAISVEKNKKAVIQNTESKVLED